MLLVRGYWEAKDTADKLDAEIEKKRKAGYPDRGHARAGEARGIDHPVFRYVEPEIEEFEHAVDEFKERGPIWRMG